MRLEQWLDAVDGRARAKARDRRPRLRADAVHEGRIDARQRRHLAAKMQIRGREAERAAELASAHHATGDGVGPAEQALRHDELARRERGTDARAGHAFAVERYGGDLAGQKAELIAESMQQL